MILITETQKVLSGMRLTPVIVVVLAAELSAVSFWTSKTTSD